MKVRSTGAVRALRHPLQFPAALVNRQPFLAFKLLLAGGVFFCCLVIGARAVFVEPRVVFAAGLGLLFFTLVITSPRLAILALMAFLPLSGDVRRLVSVQTGYSQTDPLLLVAPAAAMLIVLQATRTPGLSIDSRLSKLVTVLAGLMVVQVINPGQGGLVVGLGGLLFYFPAILWFWIGKAYGTPAFLRRLLFSVVVPLGILGSLYAFYQATVGFPGFQRDWIDSVQYSSLNVRGRLRPFSFFASTSEFSAFARLGFVAVLSYAVAARKPAAMLISLPLIAGVIIAGSRGSLVLSVAAIAFCLAVLHRNRKVWLPALVITVLVVATIGRFVLEGAADLNVTGTTASVIEHQTSGLLNPFDERESTLLIHWQLMVNGFRDSLTNPLGFGLGATTNAAGVLGGRGAGTEVDISDMFVALGLLGGLLFAWIIVEVLRDGFALWAHRRDSTSLAILAIAFTMLGSWMYAGQYSSFALTWFLIGSLDRMSSEVTLARPTDNA